MKQYFFRKALALTGSVVLVLTTGLMSAGCSSSTPQATQTSAPPVLKKVNHIGGFGIDKQALFPADLAISQSDYEQFVETTVWKPAEQKSSTTARVRTLGSYISPAADEAQRTATITLQKTSSTKSYYYVFFACKSSDEARLQSEFTITLSKGTEKRSVDMSGVGIPCDGNLSASAMRVSSFPQADSLTVSTKHPDPRISLLVQESNLLI